MVGQTIQHCTIAVSALLAKDIAIGIIGEFIEIFSSIRGRIPLICTQTFDVTSGF
jgi:hypothetical protein